ncbi:MAG: ABC transporter ATP-binding protein [Nitratireductor sp.]|nr:ABC transporter ATP-binding protein [Nitratireductor sp.]
MAELTIEHLSKRYPNSSDFAVDDVSLSVPDGEFMVLLGPSGCGKSSVLRMVAGLEPISSGTIAVDGRIVNDVPAKNRDIAMVFQSYALYPHMTVYRNMAFGLLRRGISSAETKRRVDLAAESLGLTPYLNRRPNALSGGQRQRVALGRAIVREPKIFLFDEPLSNLDAALRVTTRNQLTRQQRDMGITTVYVTHDQVEAMTMGHRVCIMNGGKVIQVGVPLEVYRKPADIFVAKFLGSPPMNVLETEISSEGGRTTVRLGNVNIPLPARGPASLAVSQKRVWLGVRPEDIHGPVPADMAEHVVSVEAKVLSVEPLGAETLLFLALAGTGQEVTARIGREARASVGEAITVSVDLRALHLFDIGTGRAISNGWSSEAGIGGAAG